MKIFKHLLYITIIGLVMGSCSSAQKIKTTTPFTMGEVTSQSWVAGVEGGGSGINVFIPVSGLNDKTALKNLYYNGKVVKLEKNAQNGKTVYIGRYKTAANQPKEIVIDANTKKEYGNKVEETSKDKIPFELEEDEAMLEFSVNGKVSYYKIANIKKVNPVAYPSASKNKAIQIRQ